MENQANIKFTILLKRKTGTTHDEYVKYHRENHAPLFSSLPEVEENVLKYVQCHTLNESLPGLPPAQFDGITELWFKDMAGLAAVFTAPRYMEIIRPDEAKFLDLHGCSFIVSTENVVIA